MLYHPPLADYLPLIQQGLAEDIGRGDITSAVFIAPDATMRAAIVAREPLVMCGLEIARTVFHTVDASLDVRIHYQDGEYVGLHAGQLLSVSGNARSILAAERTALNLMSYLSGIATQTRACVEAVAGTGTTILDTRKTLPGYRMLSKYAVRCGGGRNHRLRLDDGVMLKDNHVALAGKIAEAVVQARRAIPALTKIEVECDTLEQVMDALEAGADVIMLDNMSVEQVAFAVEVVAGRVPLEASGGMTLANIRAYAEAGVDFISLGSLTHSVKAVDLGLDVDNT
jgi:nicotinate-nucleotide pyrophosphorylase (carboxylating)